MGVKVLAHGIGVGRSRCNPYDEVTEVDITAKLNLPPCNGVLRMVGVVVEIAAVALGLMPAQPDVEGELAGPVGSLALVARSFTSIMISSSSPLS